MRMKNISLIIVICILIVSCKKDFSRQPVITTGNFDLATAIAHGTLVDQGTKDIVDHGFCWDSIGEPNLGNSKVRLGALTNTGSFQAQLLELSANRTYFLKAFISFSDEVLFGAMVTFTTPDLPVVTTTPMTEITETFARCGGEITDDYGSPVLARGVCWGIDSNPDTTGYHTSDGIGTGVFESVLTGLTANTQYYVRAYATSIYGTKYANEVEFNTGQSVTTPLVSTSAISAITQTSAISGGNVIADGGADVTARGVCWSNGPDPTIANSFTTDGTGTGSFISQLTGLTSNTTYYFRAYATNSAGTSYGSQQTFTTLTDPVLPTITTDDATDITQTTATSGGNVVSDGGAVVSVRGVCWSTSSNPTTANSTTSNGTGTGTFISYLTGLTPNTTYYVRGYAINSIGTAYGSEINFTTSSAPYYIGQSYGGGIIFYIDGTSQHGLISALSDQSIGAEWGCIGTNISGTSTTIGTGQANTTAIVNGCSSTGIAARICDDLVLNGYTDWFLPSKDELNQMYQRKDIIGNFSDDYYWSSSQINDLNAWNQLFSSGSQYACQKEYFMRRVRAVRVF